MGSLPELPLSGHCRFSLTAREISGSGVTHLRVAGAAWRQRRAIDPPIWSDHSRDEWRARPALQTDDPRRTPIASVQVLDLNRDFRFFAR